MIVCYQKQEVDSVKSKTRSPFVAVVGFMKDNTARINGVRAILSLQSTHCLLSFEPYEKGTLNDTRSLSNCSHLARHDDTITCRRSIGSCPLPPKGVI